MLVFVLILSACCFGIYKLFNGDWAADELVLILILFSLVLSIAGSCWAGNYLKPTIGVVEKQHIAQMFEQYKQQVWATQEPDGTFIWSNGINFDKVDKVRFEENCSQGYVEKRTCKHPESLFLVALVAPDIETVLVVPKGGSVFYLEKPKQLNK